MTAPVIIDAIVVIFLAGFTIYGIRRGLLQALAGLVIVIVALVGAGMIAATFSAPAAKLAAPLIEKRIEQKVDTALAEQKREVTMPEDDVDFQLEDLLDLLGLDTDVRKPLAEKAEETVRETGASLITAVVESIAQSVIYGVLYILSFLAHFLAFLLHLSAHICHSVRHLLHHPHLSCDQWVNSAWWRIRRIHLCWLWLGLSIYPPSVSIRR